MHADRFFFQMLVFDVHLYLLALIRLKGMLWGTKSIPADFPCVQFALRGVNLAHQLRVRLVAILEGQDTISQSSKQVRRQSDECPER
jgi:hypothetical protein